MKISHISIPKDHLGLHVANGGQPHLRTLPRQAGPRFTPLHPMVPPWEQGQERVASPLEKMCPAAAVPMEYPILLTGTLQYVQNHMALPHPTPTATLSHTRQHPQPPAAPGLTHRSGGCRHGRTGPQVPSTSLAGDPMGANALLSPNSGSLSPPAPLPGPPHSHCWFSCSSQCHGRLWPSQSQRSSSRSLL